MQSNESKQQISTITQLQLHISQLQTQNSQLQTQKDELLAWKAEKTKEVFGALYFILLLVIFLLKWQIAELQNAINQTNTKLGSAQE